MPELKLQRETLFRLYSEPLSRRRFRRALFAPVREGFPEDPRLRFPILAWVVRDSSCEAQRYARRIWASLPLWAQGECRETLGIDLG